MSYGVNYKLARPATLANQDTFLDKMAPIRTMNRIATTACQKFILLMNNTQLLKENRIYNTDQILVYLRGMHDDLGMSGDRGDFYRRKLAEQVYLHYKIVGVTHNNIETILHTAIQLEQKTRAIMSQNINNVPALDVNDDILSILARMAEVC